MQKKKFPVMAVVGIGCCMAVLAVMNATGGNLDLSSMFKGNEAQEQAMEAAQSASKDDTANELRGQLASRKQQNPEDPEMMAEVSAGLPEEPAILIPKVERRQETVNESATSSHWYRDGSNTKATGEEVKEKRSID